MRAHIHHWGTVLAALSLVASASAPVQAQERWEWSWGMHPMTWMWGAWGVGMMALMLAFWGLVIVGVVLAIRSLVKAGDARPTDAALDILRQRYARGEIDREEFDARRRDLDVRR